MGRRIVLALVGVGVVVGAVACTTTGGESCSDQWYDMNVWFDVPDGGANDALFEDGSPSCRTSCGADGREAPVRCYLTNAPGLQVSCQEWGRTCYL